MSRSRNVAHLPPTNSDSRNILQVNGGRWTFLSNHGHVLVSLARDPDTRTRDVAEAVGITERAVQQIVHDLVCEGYVEKTKVGRRNRYTVVRAAHLRHQQVSGVTLGELLDLLAPAGPARRRRTSKT
jgi:DNA-binding MarR family transcriptional regulator